MADVQHLESVAQQLAARVRDDDPEANLRWLRAQLGTDQDAPISDVERLCFVLAAAHSEDRGWKELIAWVDRREGIAPKVYRPSTPAEQELRRKALNQAMAPKRRAA